MDECAANQVESTLERHLGDTGSTPLGFNLSKHTHEHTCVLCAVHLCNLLSLYRNGIREVAHPVCCI